LCEFVVYFGQFLLSNAFCHHVEAHRLARQLGLCVILGIWNVEILFLARRHAAKVLGKGREGVVAAHVQHHLVLLDGRAFDSREAFDGNYGMIAILNGPGVDVAVIRLLIAEFFDALGDVIVSDLWVFVLDGEVAVIVV